MNTFEDFSVIQVEFVAQMSAWRTAVLELRTAVYSPGNADRNGDPDEYGLAMLESCNRAYQFFAQGVLLETVTGEHVEHAGSCVAACRRITNHIRNKKVA